MRRTGDERGVFDDRRKCVRALQFDGLAGKPARRTEKTGQDSIANQQTTFEAHSDFPLRAKIFPFRNFQVVVDRAESGSVSHYLI
jgi:hypothetical protein